MLSRKIITYYTLTLLVVVPGICLCSIFYKYKIVPRKKKVTFMHISNPSIIKRSHSIEIEGSLYYSIDDTDMAGFIDQQEISPDQLDMISGSTCTLGDANISSFDNGQYEKTQQWIHQPVNTISPPTISDYITQATVHSIDSNMPDNDETIPCESKDSGQDRKAPQKDVVRLPYEHGISSIIDRYTATQRGLFKIPKRVSKSCDNLKTESVKFRIFSESNGEHINSFEVDRLNFYDISKTKSESYIY